MPRVQIVLVDRMIGVCRGLAGRQPHRPPEVRHVAVQVVDRFVPAPAVWTREQHRPGAEERLNVVLHVSESGPHFWRDLALPTEPRERRLERHHSRSWTGIGPVTTYARAPARFAAVLATAPACSKPRNRAHRLGRLICRYSLASICVPPKPPRFFSH